MNEKGVADKLKVSEESVRLAEKKALAAREDLTSWRTAHGNIDPTATVAMLLNLSSQLEAELSTAQINLDKIRSEEHTSELQSLMRISYAVFCLKKKTNT